jgi:TatD related DNase
MIDTATVASLPIERLLTETDGPFVEIANRPVRPSDVEVTIAAFSRFHKAETASISTAAAPSYRVAHHRTGVVKMTASHQPLCARPPPSQKSRRR